MLANANKRSVCVSWPSDSLARTVPAVARSQGEVVLHDRVQAVHPDLQRVQENHLLRVQNLELHLHLVENHHHHHQRHLQSCLHLLVRLRAQSRLVPLH